MRNWPVIYAHRFDINSYNPCVANKAVEGKQLKITWHVDDLKISNAGSRVISDTILFLESIYDKTHITCGKQH